MSDWKNAFRSFYYATAEEPEDPDLLSGETALLVIDIQNTCMEVPGDADEDCCAAATMELHEHEMKVINMIYCHVVQSEDIPTFMRD